MTATITPYRSDHSDGRDGFGQLVRAEWTKFRTVRGWVIALIAAAVVTAVIPIDLASSARNAVESCAAAGACQAEGQNIAIGPAGEAVTDTFYFVHQPLAGHGSITVRVTSLQGTGSPAVPGFPAPPRTQPWAKAGIIIKQSTAPGSQYAAVMVTGGHGVRMQDNYTRDTAGPAGTVSAASPRWLRLTRSGSTLTGYESSDGTHWSAIGTADLTGLPSTVQAGLFVASPNLQEATQSFGGGDSALIAATRATAAFDHVTVAGGPAGHAWSGSRVGDGQTTLPAGHGHQCPAPCGQPAPKPGGFTAAGGTFTVAGTGDIAPFVPTVKPLQVSFYGTLFGLLAVIALGALFITGEYRRGLIRTTLTASPRRGRVLVAKAIVIGSVTFAAALGGAATAFPIAERELNANGWKPPVWHVMSLTSGIGLQVVVGTAALVAVTAVLAMCAGAILRRSAGAIAAVVGLVVFPLILAIVLPLTPADWLLRLTPAAAFSLQQAFPRYSQVSSGCVPYHGCYPLAPWTGFAVMCAWAVAALGLAIFLLRRRDV
jgi:ABC-type transport system involved in multi-copper enzyme maturation permease subunit